MTNQEFQELVKIYEILISGRIDFARTELERFLGIEVPQEENGES